MKSLTLISLLLLSSCSNNTPLLQAVGAEKEYSEVTTANLYDRYGVVNSPLLSTFLDRVSKRLSSALFPAAYSFASSSAYPGAASSIETDTNWQFFILNSRHPSAFSVGNGAIFITGGLLESAHTEAEIAAVISREMAHNALGHITQSFVATDTDAKQPQGIRLTGDQEISADLFALEILRSAHYNPEALVSAISLYSRPIDRKVSKEYENFLHERAGIIASMLRSMPSRMTSTNSTREFAKLQHMLSQEKLTSAPLP